MGEENRNSSGSTAMIVVAILGGILLIGCCGGIVVIGAGGLWMRSELQVAPDPVDSPIREQLRHDMDSIKNPDAAPLVPPPELKPPGIESLLPPSRVLDETKE